MLLHLPDPEPALADRPEYAIQLANQGVWEPASGFNNLLHQIVVSNGANQPGILASQNPICPGQQAMLVLTGSGFSTIQWYRDSLEIPGATTAFFSTATAGIYQVFVTNAAGCGRFSNEIQLEVVPDPLLSITGLDTAYTDQDLPVMLIASQPGGTFSGPGVSGNQFFPVVAGVGQHQISYLLTDSNGCTFQAFFTVTVSPFVSTTLPEGFAGIQLFPNPTRGDFYLKMDLIVSKNLNFNLLDSNSGVVERRAARFPAGQSVLLFESRELSGGVYVLEVSDEQGNAFRQRVVLVK